MANSLNKGIRLDLASISRTRSIDIPKIPGGIILWGSAACYLGVTILIPPLGYAVSLLGAGSVLSHFIFKNPALVIETNIGDRHIIQSKLQDQEVLLKIQMMIDKVSNGQSVAEAKRCLEREFKLSQDSKREPKGLLNAPNIEEINVGIMNQIQPLEEFSNKPQIEMRGVQPEISVPLFEIQEPVANKHFNSRINTDEKPHEISERTSAYQHTWGRNEPEWYNERTHENRIEEATETMNEDSFGFEAGGMFDFEPTTSSFTEPVNYSPPPEQYITQQENEVEPTNSIFGSYKTELGIRDRPRSSADMIKTANGLKRSPVNNYYNNLELPAPTNEAVRVECKPGLVKRAKAQQSLYRKAEIMAALPAPTDLGEYPGLSKIADSFGDGRLVLRNQPIRKRRLGLLERLLVPKSRNLAKHNPSYASEYGDPDGIDANESARFQTEQHLRLRSDQEHQADITNRNRNKNNAKAPSAQDAMNLVMNRVARGEEHSPTVLINDEPMLRFNQMRRTSNKDDSGHVKGIRRLD